MGDSEDTVSDIEFVRAVIQDLQAVPGADLFAFCGGFSNGGVGERGCSSAR